MYSLRGCRLAVISLLILWTALYSALKAYVAPNFTATSHNPSMAAFCGVCLVNMMWITFLGFRAWPSVPKSAKNGLSLWKTNAAGQELAIIQCAFQGWDLAMCFFLPELQNFLMIVHHLLVTILSGACYEVNIMHEPALFFLGLSEMQGVPLTLIDFFTHIPPDHFPNPIFANLVFDVTKYAFALLFFYARIYLWFKHTIAFAKNANHALSVNEKKRGRSLIRLFVVACIVLTALQIYWGFLIMREASGLLLG